MSAHTDERPHFEKRQVRTTKGLPVGKELTNVPFGFKYRINGKPYQDSDGSWWIKVIWIHSDGTEVDDTISLADHNIVPYINTGKWNPTNWLKRR